MDACARPSTIHGSSTACIYRSRFQDWNTRSAVRSKPLPEFARTDAGLFFTPELVPLVDHPLISARAIT